MERDELKSYAKLGKYS